MFRSVITNSKLHRSNCSSSVFVGSFNPCITSNPKGKNNDTKMKHLYNTNDESIDYSSFTSLRRSKQSRDNLLVNDALSHSVNSVFRKRSNTLPINSSTLLMRKYSDNVSVARLRPFGARNFSEVIGHPPLIRLTGIWKTFSESAPVEFVQQHLIDFQSATNLPWWATIVVTTFIVRSTFTLPLSLYQHYIIAKVQNLSVKMNDDIKHLKIEANIAVSHHNWSEQDARFVYEQTVRKKWNELIQKENCHPAKGFIVLWTQIPLWIMISASLRNICYMLPPSSMNAEKVYLDLTTGGFGWVVNLVDVDCYWVIPISVGIANLMNIEIMSLMKIKEETKLQRYLLYFLRFVSVGMIVLACYVPACISLYWLSSSTFGLLQNLVLLSPKIRRLAGIPLTPTERANPYRHLIAQFRSKQYINFSRNSKKL